MDTSFIGIVGLALLLIGWVPETISNFRQNGKNLDLKFAVLYFFGSVFLAWHALNLNDLTFVALNAAASAIAALNAYIILSNRKKG